VQLNILKKAWSMLAPGGRLVYATCSILKAENAEVVEAFLNEQADASEVPIDAEWGRRLSHGRQILPGEEGMDGFYYAVLVKSH
jgi:16S rRNA (cytosine967-C5)-methyltransferase